MHRSRSGIEIRNNGHTFVLREFRYLRGLQVLLPLAFLLIGKRPPIVDSCTRAPLLTSDPLFHSVYARDLFPALQAPLHQLGFPRRLRKRLLNLRRELRCATHPLCYLRGPSTLTHTSPQNCSDREGSLISFTSCLCEPTPKASISACLGCSGNSTDSRADHCAQDMVGELDS